MANTDPTVIMRASATPPTLAEGQLGVLSLDLAGNLRTSGSASTSAGASSVTILGGTSSVTLLGTSTVSNVGVSNVSLIGTVPVTLSSTSLTGVSAVSHVGTQPVSLQATTVTASVGTITLGASNTAASLASFQLAATVATASIGTITLGAASNAASLATFQLAAGVATASLGTITLGASSNLNSLATFSIQGLVANDAVLSGNPVLTGGRAAATAPPTAVADGDVVSGQFDKYGRAIVSVAPQDLWGQGTVIIAASTATTSVIAAAGASTKWALSTVGVTSTQTATTCRVDIVDGINNLGTIIHSFWFPAGISAQDGMSPFITFDPPWVCSANTAIGAKCSASVTDVRVVATAFKVL